MIASTTAAGVYDDADHNTTQSSLVDIFEPAGISWKAYQEGLLPSGWWYLQPYPPEQDLGPRPVRLLLQVTAKSYDTYTDNPI